MSDQEDVYDVFLSHSSTDKKAVEAIARRLLAQGVRPFLDKWHLIPGRPWQEALEWALDRSTACAVFLGPSGISPWQNEEMRAALEERACRRASGVVPVLLPGSSPEADEVPRFLRRLTWCDFRGGLDAAEPLQRLLAGISGHAPGPPEPAPIGSRGIDVSLEDDVPMPRAGTGEAVDRAVVRLRANPYAWRRRSVLDRATRAIVEGQLPVVLRGLGGVGKTTILAQLAVELKSRFPRMLAISLDGPAREEPAYILDELNAFLTELGRGIDLRQMQGRDQRATFAALLERFVGVDLLLLVDGVDVAPAEAQNWLLAEFATLSTVRIAATVQERSPGGISTNVIAVPLLSPDEAIEFVEAMGPLLGVSVNPSDLIKRLPRALATHPQALATVLAHSRDLPLELLFLEGVPEESRAPARWVQLTLESMGTQDQEVLALVAMLGGLDFAAALNRIDPPLPAGFQDSLQLLLERSLVVRTGTVLDVPALVGDALLKVAPTVVAGVARDLTEAVIGKGTQPAAPDQDVAALAEITAQVAVHLDAAELWSLLLDVANPKFLDLLNARGLWKEYAVLLRIGFRAAATAESEKDAVDLGCRLTRKLLQMGDPEGAGEALDEVGRLIGTEGDSPLHAELFSHRALLSWTADDEAALEHLGRSRAIREAHRDQAGLLVVCKLIGNIHLARGEYAAARAAYEEGLAIDPAEVEETDRLETETCVAFCDLNQGEARVAADRLRYVIRRMRELRYLAGQPNALLGLALALEGLDQPGEALTAAREALSLRAGDPQVARAVEMLTWRLETTTDLVAQKDAIRQ
jgi:tetratricopeptide (TPR) repeat protein